MPTGEALQAMYENVRGTLEYQFRTSESVDDKAARVFRFSLLIAGLVSTSASVLASRDRLWILLPPWLIVLTAGGLCLLIVSSLFSLLAYRGTDVRIGLKAEDVLEAARDPHLDQTSFHREATIASAYGVIDNNKNLSQSTNRLDWATRALWSAISLLAVVAIGLLARAGQLGVSAHGG